MIYYNRTDFREGINTNKISESKDVCHYVCVMFATIYIF